jgi:hypothetical protein
MIRERCIFPIRKTLRLRRGFEEHYFRLSLDLSGGEGFQNVKRTIASFMSERYLPGRIFGSHLKRIIGGVYELLFWKTTPLDSA